MKIYTFNTCNNSKKNNKFFTFCNSNNNTNYSALLDDIISSNIKKTSSYLTKIENDNLIDGLIAEAKSTSCKCLKGNDFITALTYIANFGINNKLPFKLGHAYYFGGKTPIIFHLDSIQIGGTEYYYDDLLNNTFTPSTKKTIIDIYLNGNKNIDIDINL